MDRRKEADIKWSSVTDVESDWRVVKWDKAREREFETSKRTHIDAWHEFRWHFGSFETKEELVLAWEQWLLIASRSCWCFVCDDFC